MKLVLTNLTWINYISAYSILVYISHRPFRDGLVIYRRFNIYHIFRPFHDSSTFSTMVRPFHDGSTFFIWFRYFTMIWPFYYGSIFFLWFGYFTMIWPFYYGSTISWWFGLFSMVRPLRDGLIIFGLLLPKTKDTPITSSTTPIFTFPMHYYKLTLQGTSDTIYTSQDTSKGKL